jgi:osmotically-inducible protein OsmY
MKYSKKIRSYGILTLLIILTFPYLITASETENTPYASNSEIEKMISSNFSSDTNIDTSNIVIISDQGIITIKGKVDSIIEKEKLGSIAEEIRGVKEVINQLKVNSIPRSNHQLEKLVRLALVEDPVSEIFEIRVSAENGVVDLNGVVDSYYEKEFAERTVKGVIGVRKIKNNIKVNSRLNRVDEEIREELESRIRNDIRIDTSMIDIDVTDGVAVLSGYVNTLSERKLVIRNSWISGVKDIKAKNLKINPSQKSYNSVTKPTQLNTDQIEKQISKAYQYDPKLKKSDIKIQVRDSGKVILTGLTNNLRAKRSATTQARNIRGVTKVINKIKIKNDEYLSNYELNKKVKSALMRDPYLSQYDIEVNSRNRRVVLSGKVKNFHSKKRAEQIAEKINGVNQVINKTTYPQSWRKKSDPIIEKNILGQIKSSPYIDPSQVLVQSKNGVVTLKGEVYNYSAKSAAQKEAFDGGAKKVRNKITVEEKAYGPFYYPFENYYEEYLNKTNPRYRY